MPGLESVALMPRQVIEPVAIRDVDDRPVPVPRPELLTAALVLGVEPFDRLSMPPHGPGFS